MDVDALSLAKLVKARPPIYNTKKQGDKGKLWQEIATEMNWSVTECKKKWLCLRIAYCRYLRGDTRTLNRLGRERRKWYLADPMSFLRPYVRPSREKSNSLDSHHNEEFQKNMGSVLDESLHSTAGAEEPFKSVKYELSPETKEHLINDLIQEADREVTYAQPEDREKEYFPESSLSNPQEDANLLYFQSLFADYGKLSSRRQRTFKMHMLRKMQELQEEDENELLNMRRPAQTMLHGNTPFEKWRN